MLKFVSTCLLSTLFLFSQSGDIKKATSYRVTIKVSSTKLNGKSWDSFGGAPDVMIKVGNTLLPFKKSCKDSYKCSYEFTSNKDKWYFEIYDKDLKQHDLIGKGDCELGKKCKLGLADLNVSKK